MIDLSNEQIIPLSAAARALPPSKGKRRHTSTVFRWATGGVIGPDGKRIRLDHIRIGRGWFTSREAVQRFAEALTGRADQDLDAIRTSSQRNRASAEAERELADLGI